MGSGSVLGLADTTPARGQITVVNGGEDQIWLWTVLTNPVRQDAPVDGRLTALDGGGTRLELTFPEELQTISGVPIGLKRLRLRAGRDDWLTTTACPDDGRWPYRGEARFADGTSASYADDVPCS
jgi:hypothetical protein